MAVIREQCSLSFARLAAKSNPAAMRKIRDSGNVPEVLAVVNEAEFRNAPTTALHEAARGGSMETLRYLLSLEGVRDDIDVIDGKGNSAAHVAAKEGHPHILQALLDAGADASWRNHDDETPLHVAAYHGKMDTCKVLLACSAKLVKLKDKGFETPLTKAIYSGSIAIARVLLQHGASAEDHVTLRRYSHLHMCAGIPGSVETARDILVQAPSLVADADNERGYVPLHIACKEANLEMVSLLLEHKSPLDVESAEGLTPFDYAECAVEKIDGSTTFGADLPPVPAGGNATLRLRMDVLAQMRDAGASRGKARTRLYEASQLSEVGKAWDAVYTSMGVLIGFVLTFIAWIRSRIVNPIVSVVMRRDAPSLENLSKKEWDVLFHISGLELSRRGYTSKQRKVIATKRRERQITNFKLIGDQMDSPEERAEFFELIKDPAVLEGLQELEMSMGRPKEFHEVVNKWKHLPEVMKVWSMFMRTNDAIGMSYDGSNVELAHGQPRRRVFPGNSDAILAAQMAPSTMDHKTAPAMANWLEERAQRLAAEAKANGAPVMRGMKKEGPVRSR